VLQAMTLRETRHLSPELQENFRRTGLSHLLVVSGLNFGLILGFFYFPAYLLLSLWRSGAERGWARPFALVLALLPTCGYGALVGWTSPVLRSLGGVFLMGSAVLAGWRRNFFSLLLLTCLALLLWRPLLFWDLSFQLSFFSVLSVWLFAGEFKNFLQRLGTGGSAALRILLRFPIFLFSLSIAVNLPLYPWFAEYFHEFSLIGPVANLLFVPVFSWVLMPGSLLAGALCRSSLSLEIFALLGSLLQACLQAIRALGAWSHASIFVAPLRGLQWPAYGFFLAGIFQFSRLRRLLLCWIPALALAGMHYSCGAFRSHSPEMRLTLVDVGQGDAMLLETPSGRGVMVDGGGLVYSDFDLGRNVLLPELLSRGSRRIDAMVLSHPDADHAKGLLFLLERWPVAEFWLTEATWEHPDFAKHRKLITERGIRLRFLEQGKKFAYGGAGLEVLWPPRGWTGKDNDQSLVLRACYLQRCFLLTGDIEGAAEQALTGSTLGIQSDVLKIPHHGSRSSSTESFLCKVAPALAIVSLGKDNRFRFPHPQVTKRLSAQGIPLLRTDQDGQIEVATDGQELSYRTFREGFKERHVPSRWYAILRGLFFGRS